MFPEIVPHRPSPIPDAFIHTTKKPLSTDKFIHSLNEGLKEPGRDRSVHPFVLAVEKGEATLNQIGAWRHQINYHSYPINKLFGVMWSRCPDADLSQGILENMQEEEHGMHSNTAGHVALTAKFMDECGWTADRRAKVGPHMEVLAVRHWHELVMTQRSIVEAIGVISFTTERRNPEVFSRMMTGFKKHYKPSEEAMLAIGVHASHVEEEHGTLGPAAFERYATTGYMQDRIRFACYHSAELYYNAYNVWQYYD